MGSKVPSEPPKDKYKGPPPPPPPPRKYEPSILDVEGPSIVQEWVRKSFALLPSKDQEKDLKPWFIALLVSVLFGILSSWYFYHAGYDKGFKQGKWAEYFEGEERRAR